MRRLTGHYERTSAAGEAVDAFIPAPLPPASPPLHLDERLRERVRQAEGALARLEVAGEMVPSVDWFIYAFVRKEAVVSSQIEGTQATLIDLLAYEAESFAARPDADVEEVCNYVEALRFARASLQRERGLPLSMRLLDATHAKLMQGARGADKQPGELRRSQNWVGGARPAAAAHVPPPPHLLPALLSDFERYLHPEDGLPPVVRAGLLHVQFETLHPYLDGNGRIGRLLVTLLFEHWGLLKQPLLYLSLHFKRHRAEYYRRLSAVRTDGDWEGWTAYFLEGVATIAQEATQTARDLFARVTDDRRRVLAAPRSTLVSARLVEELPKHPIVTVASVAELLGTTPPTATKAIGVLVEAGILVETTGRQRGRTFHYQDYLDRLRAGTELESGP